MCVCLPHSLPVLVCASLSVSLCHWFYLCLPVCVIVRLSRCYFFVGTRTVKNFDVLVSECLPAYVFLWLSICLSLSVCLYVCLSLTPLIFRDPISLSYYFGLFFDYVSLHHSLDNAVYLRVLRYLSSSHCHSLHSDVPHGFGHLS